MGEIAASTNSKKEVNVSVLRRVDVEERINRK